MKSPIKSELKEFYEENFEAIEQLWALSEKVKESVDNQIKGLKIFCDNNQDDTGYYEIRAVKGIYLHKNKNKENKSKAKQHVVVAVFYNKLYSQERKITVAIEIIGKDFIRSCYDNFDKLNIDLDLKEHVNVNREWAHICAVSSEVTVLQQTPIIITRLLETKIDGVISPKEILESIDAYYHKEFKEDNSQK